MDVQITVQMVIRNACDDDDLNHYGQYTTSGYELVSPLMDWIQTLITDEGLMGVVEEESISLIKATKLD